MTAVVSELRTPRPQGAKHLRASEWADWFEQAIAGPRVVVAKDGARDLIVILRAAALRLTPNPSQVPNAKLPMTMSTLRVPSHKQRPKFADDVPPQVRRLIWIKWFQQQAATERPFYALSTPACLELAELLAAE